MSEAARMPRIHERFDLTRWTAEFPLARARAEARAFVEDCARRDPGAYTSAAAKEEHAQLMSPHGDIIVGPASMAYAEQLRAEAGPPETFGPGVPVDVMVWGLGEPGHPAATKVGGVPYRPVSEPWPKGRGGRDSTFIGQICFADSLDVLPRGAGALPGDVLLIFAPDEDGIWDSDEEDPACVQHEWWPLGLEAPCGAGDLPAGVSPFEVCFAQLHRTMDYTDVSEGHPIRAHYDVGRLCVFEGGKVGGVPHYVQDADARPGVFLGAIGSINPVEERFPLIGVETNPGGSLNKDGGFLMFGDCGSLYLFLSRTGLLKKRDRLHWTVQGY